MPKLVTLSVRVTEELLRAVKVAAAKDGISMQRFATDALTSALVKKGHVKGGG